MKLMTRMLNFLMTRLLHVVFVAEVDLYSLPLLDTVSAVGRSEIGIDTCNNCSTSEGSLNCSVTCSFSFCKTYIHTYTLILIASSWDLLQKTGKYTATD